MADKPWKRVERELAALVGGIRQPNTGGHHEDVSHTLFSFQVKKRNSMPDWFTQAIKQAINDAPSGKVPTTVFALTKRGRGNKTEWFFVLDLDAWLDLHGGNNETGNPD